MCFSPRATRFLSPGTRCGSGDPYMRSDVAETSRRYLMAATTARHCPTASMYRFFQVFLKYGRFGVAKRVFHYYQAKIIYLPCRRRSPSVEHVFRLPPTTSPDGSSPSRGKMRRRSMERTRSSIVFFSALGASA